MVATRDQQVWRVLAWDGERQMWVVQDTRDTQADAQQVAEAIQHRDKRRRVRVKPGVRRVVLVKPPIVNRAREFRLEQAGQMMDRADANKRYKSPG